MGPTFEVILSYLIFTVLVRKDRRKTGIPRSQKGVLNTVIDTEKTYKGNSMTPLREDKDKKNYLYTM